MPSTILLQAPTEVPAEHLRFAREFILSCRFQLAKQGDLGGAPVVESPHEYSVRRWQHAAGRIAFDTFIGLIAEHGYKGRFLSTVYTYLDVDGWRYWKSPGYFDRTDVMLNRASNRDAPVLRLGTEPAHIEQTFRGQVWTPADDSQERLFPDVAAPPPTRTATGTGRPRNHQDGSTRPARGSRAPQARWYEYVDGKPPVERSASRPSPGAARFRNQAEARRWLDNVKLPELRGDVGLLPGFTEFADEWLAGKRSEDLEPNTIAHLEWAVGHLKAHFGTTRVDAITPEAVDAYTAAKLKEDKPLAASSINRTVIALATMLKRPAEYGRLGRANPAESKDRRLRVKAKPPRLYLDSAEQIDALLRAGQQLDEHVAEVESARKLENRSHMNRRAILAVLVFAGLRIGELTTLRWGHVYLADGFLKVVDAKTPKGYRRIEIRPCLRDELLEIAPPNAHPEAFVFATTRGGQQSTANLRNRVVMPAAKLANELLVAKNRPLLPERIDKKGKVIRISPHGLRRTFASVMYAIGVDPGIVMDEMGHTTAGLALEVYRQSMRRGKRETAALKALVKGADWNAFYADERFAGPQRAQDAQREGRLA